MRGDVEVVVVGAGMAGLATAYALARDGREVLLLERFSLGHEHGSSHGSSRIFRLAYSEPEYVRLAEQALDAWRALEADAGERLLVQVGNLDVGPHAEPTREALEAAGLASEWVGADELAARFGIRVAEGVPALLQPDGGYARADRTLRALADGALAAGAELVAGSPVEALRDEAGAVVLDTAGGSVHARVAVVTAGAWARPLLAGAGIELPVVETRETVAYFDLAGAEPVSVIDSTVSHRWGYALSAPGRGLKAGLHMSGTPANPSAPGEPDPAVVAGATAWVRDRFPRALAEPTGAETCLYTTTADERFVLARHGRVVVGSACSGHGFKFAPLTGRRLAALAVEALAA